MSLSQFFTSETEFQALKRVIQQNEENAAQAQEREKFVKNQVVSLEIQCEANRKKIESIKADIKEYCTLEKYCELDAKIKRLPGRQVTDALRQNFENYAKSTDVTELARFLQPQIDDLTKRVSQ